MKKIFVQTLCGFLALAVAGSLGAQDRRSSEKGQMRLQKEVRHELVMLPYYDVFDNLAYKVEGGNVTLFGQVTRPTLKSDAERAVKGIEGVDRVENRIEVHEFTRFPPVNAGFSIGKQIDKQVPHPSGAFGNEVQTYPCLAIERARIAANEKLRISSDHT